MYNHRVRRTNIYLDDLQLDALRARALASHRSVADLVREAVDLSLAPAAPLRRTPGSGAATSIPMGPRPQRGEDWKRRPYFLPDAQLTWAEFVGLVHSQDDDARRWALTRLLDGGRWPDIWWLVGRDDIKRDLPRLRFRHEEFWQRYLAAAA